MATSRKFIWVWIDRDRTPEIAARWSVSAYPSHIVLGRREEKVHRWSGFREPKEFVAQLEEGLRRYALYKEGKEWDTPNPRPEKLCEEGVVEILKAPSEDVPGGLVVLGSDLLVAQGGRLARIDLKTGATGKAVEIPEGVIGIAGDGKSLWGAHYGWTAGLPIYELDPATGKAVREIITEANRKNKAMGTKGLAWRDGRLAVLEGMRGAIHEVDPKTGEIVRTVELKETWLAGLAFDGTHYVCGGRTHLVFADPASGEVKRKIAVNYPIRCVAAWEGSLWLMEQPTFGFDKDNKPVRVWPKETAVYKLTLK